MNVATTPVVELRRQFKQGKQALIDAFLEARPTTTTSSRLLRTLARHVDDTLRLIWAESGLPAGACLATVGGYGRGELFPHSDVDVLVLLPDGDKPDPRIEGFIHALWDIGLEPGSSVRTVTECAEEAAKDITVDTSLLEARHVAGEAEQRDHRQADRG